MHVSLYVCDQTYMSSFVYIAFGVVVIGKSTQFPYLSLHKYSPLMGVGGSTLYTKHIWSSVCGDQPPFNIQM